MDVNPSYLNWCIKYCTGIIIRLEDTALEELKLIYPNFIMDKLFESKRVWNLTRDPSDYSYENCDDYDDIFFKNYNEYPSYESFSGSWAQDIEGYSDDEIDTIFDGDPSAYWSVD